MLAPLHRHLSPSPRVELATFSACGSPAAIQCWTRSQRHSHAGRLELRFASVLPSLPAVTQRTRPVGVHANYGLGTSYIALCACAGRGTCASRHDGALALVRCFLGFDAVSALSPLTAIRTRGLGCLSRPTCLTDAHASLQSAAFAAFSARRARCSVLERYDPGLFDPLEEAGGGPRIQEDRRSTQSRAGTSVAWVRLLYLEFVLSLTFGCTLASSAARAENLQRTQLVSHGVCDRLESLRVLTQDRRKLSIQPTRGTIL